MDRLPEYKLEAVPTDETAEKALGFKWAKDPIGRRHQLGGEPGWIQGEDAPRCPDCGQRMTFYGQLDSIGDDVCIADCGMVYVFVCFDDLLAEAILQTH